MLRTKKLGFIVILGFVLGFIITISEPDLQVLAEQVSSVPNMVLILSVALGVGAFLVVALLRILFGNRAAAVVILFLYSGFCHCNVRSGKIFWQWPLIPAG